MEDGDGDCASNWDWFQELRIDATRSSNDSNASMPVPAAPAGLAKTRSLIDDDFRCVSRNPFFDLPDDWQRPQQQPSSSASPQQQPVDVRDFLSFDPQRSDLLLDSDSKFETNPSPSELLPDEGGEDEVPRTPEANSLAPTVPLPEFVGRGGGEGIFKLPPRAAVHPLRPPSLELRPHPLRETQAGVFLRTIACTDSQLWAGQECGVRLWNFDEMFEGKELLSGGPLGDDESAPFLQSLSTPPAMCLAVDVANRLVWSGHKDGRVRSWSMDQTRGNSHCAVSPFREGISWQAHRGPVLSMVFTSHGDLWTGSECGGIKVWPWEAIDSSLSFAMEKRHIAITRVERSYVDLRSKLTVGGACPLPSGDVKFLLSDNSRSKIWSGTSLSFALWNSCTKELLKVFGADGLVETRVDVSLDHEFYAEEETKIKYAPILKKDKPQGPMSFFQRSRNVLMGAADAVLRVATMGTFGDDSRRTEAITISMDGMVWTGCANGSIVQWDGNGNRLQEFRYKTYSVQCLCAYGTQLWVGYVDGVIQLLDLDGIQVIAWPAHSSPIIDMAVGGNYIFTLANHGGIRGWSLTFPGPLDSILRSELTKKQQTFAKLENLKILVGTWNVGQERASNDSLISWIGCSASEAALVVVGLQEVEMGAGFLAMAAAKETVGLEGSANGNWWLGTIGKILDEKTTFERVGSRQLAGLLICIWARKDLMAHIGDIDAGAVPCGFGRAIGNKGSVGLRMRIYDRVFCFLNCHFAAHLEAVNRRNADFNHVFRSMSFSKTSSGYHSSAGSTTAVQLLRGTNITGSQMEDEKSDLSEADMVVFLGDFNYRLQGVTYDEARDLVSKGSFDWLKEKDQLQGEMIGGRVFQGMREGEIRFPPTYKFEKHQPGLAGYDSGEKKRVPAWCDRVLYRDNCTSAGEECSLECPVASSVLQYDSCMDVIDSDHKPVRCLFNVNIVRVNELVRRQRFGEALSSNKSVRSLQKEIFNIPEVIISTNNLILQDQEASILRISNKCHKGIAVFRISSAGESSSKEDGPTHKHHPRGAFGLPRWLEVTPASGIIKPGQIVEVSLQHEEFHTFEEYIDGTAQNWYCEDARDKEVLLVLNVSGIFSTDSRAHKVRVCHCLSSKTTGENRKDMSKRVQSNLLHRSDIHRLGNSTDVDDLHCLHDR